MFGDMFGNMQEKQETLKKKLSEMTVDVEMGGVSVSANCNREITNIQFDKAKLDWEDQEQVEDTLIAAINKALEKAAAKETEETESLLKDLLPPGMGDMGNLFG